MRGASLCLWSGEEEKKREGRGRREEEERAREKGKRIKGEKKWKREGRGQTDPLVLTIRAPQSGYYSPSPNKNRKECSILEPYLILYNQREMIGNDYLFVCLKQWNIFLLFPKK